MKFFEDFLRFARKSLKFLADFTQTDPLLIYKTPVNNSKLLLLLVKLKLNYELLPGKLDKTLSFYNKSLSI